MTDGRNRMDDDDRQWRRARLEVLRREITFHRDRARFHDYRADLIQREFDTLAAIDAS